MIPGNILPSCRHALCLAVFGLAVLFTAGCGGGSSSGTRASSPTAQTRTRLASLQNQQLRALSQSGVQPSALATARNGAFASAPTLSVGATPAGGGVTAGLGATGSGTPISAFPLIGAFITNVAAVRPTPPATATSVIKGRAATHRTRAPHNTRDDGSDPNFYFDDYLGLWVEIQNTDTSSSFLLYLDEAKNQPAGSFQTTFSVSDAFPQSYESHYTITAGTLQGTHGDYVTVQNADNSGSSTYNDTYLDGWSDQGQSIWNADGSSSWTSRNDGPGGVFYTYQGNFNADGSGANHSASSDGYITDYTYRANGSSTGRIQGPDPGLPATVTIDIYGDTTIRYADGSIEYDPGWGFNSGGLVAVSGVASGGVATTTASASSIKRTGSNSK